jgi:mannosyltransferase OCH1-like enzyme
MVNEMDVARLANATWARRRIPRLIHQTWRTHDVPLKWNVSYHSVIGQNADEFKHYLWTDEEMRVFVQEHEPEFYKSTYGTYKYDIQRADSFRNVVLYHLGGIYIDLDNGCKHPFKDLLTTLEALDPEAPHLVAYPDDGEFGFLFDFTVSTAGHPLHKQLISRLHLFNYNFLFHYLTVYLASGPLYAIIQERLFNSSEQQVVRILTAAVENIFIWRIQSRTWHSLDDKILIYIYENGYRIYHQPKICVIVLTILLILMMLFRRRRQYLSLLTHTVSLCVTYWVTSFSKEKFESSNRYHDFVHAKGLFRQLRRGV